MKKLGPVKHLRVCYEAGPTGYVVDWQLTALGVKCEVVAAARPPTADHDEGVDAGPPRLGEERGARERGRRLRRAGEHATGEHQQQGCRRQGK